MPDLILDLARIASYRVEFIFCLLRQIAGPSHLGQRQHIVQQALLVG